MHARPAFDGQRRTAALWQPVNRNFLKMAEIWEWNAIHICHHARNMSGLHTAQTFTWSLADDATPSFGEPYEQHPRASDSPSCHKIMLLREPTMGNKFGLKN